MRAMSRGATRLDGDTLRSSVLLVLHSRAAEVQDGVSDLSGAFETNACDISAELFVGIFKENMCFREIEKYKQNMGD